MSRVPPGEIELRFVSDETELAAFRDWKPDLLGGAGHFACDTETTGLQPFGPKRDHLRLVQFGDENVGWAVPIDHLTNSHPNWLAVQEKLDTYDGFLVGHNSPFDENFLATEGFDPGAQWDNTYIMHHLLYPTDYHGLKPMAGQFYGREVRGGEKWLDKVKAKNGWDWATVPVDHPAYWGYGALDAVLTARAANDMVAPLGRYREQYDREQKVAAMTWRMASSGLLIDMPYVEELAERWQTEIDSLRAQLDKFAISNPGSRVQIIAALTNDGWEPDVLTETGQPAVNRAVLEGLDHEIAPLLLRWRRLTKWRTAYLKPFLDSGGRIFPNISSLRAATGRMAVSEPPLQQLPKGAEVRSAIKTEEGTEMWAVDFTGQEARLLASYVGDPAFTDEVLNGGDIHGNIARQIHGENYTKEQRGWDKNAFYAYCYGAAEARLAETAHAPRGAFEKAVAKAYPPIAGFMDSVIQKGRQRFEADGMAWATTVGGRRVAVPKSRLYALTNYIMQGGGADLMKMALIKMDALGLTDSIKLVIHDEVLACLPPGSTEAVEEIVKCMETTFRGVPFEAHATGPGQSWGEVA